MPAVTPPCANCACDLTQFIEQITNNNTTNTTKIENQLKFGFDRIFDATVKLPDIAAGIAIIQTNIRFLSDIRADLNFVRNTTQQIGDGQSGIRREIFDGVIGSLTEANRQITTIAGFTSLVLSLEFCPS